MNHLAATQAESVQSRIKAVEQLGRHGTMPWYWRNNLALAFAADEVAAREVLDLLEAAYVFLSRFVDTEAAREDGFDVHAWCEAAEDVLRPTADSTPRPDV